MPIRGDYDTLIANKTGDRMVEFPKFYYKRPNKWTWLVSPDYVEGFLPSPMYYRNGVMHDTVRVSEYMLSTSGSTVISQPGTTPRVSTTIADFRTMLRAKGQYVIDMSSYSMIVILAIIKYADINSRLASGAGIYSGTAKAMGDSILGLDEYRTSLTDNLNVRCMGIEDLWGNPWNYLDGIFVYNGNIYINNDIENIYLNPDILTCLQNGWTKLDTTAPQGIRNTIFNNISFDSKCPSILFPTSMGGDSTNPIGCGYFNGSGNTQFAVSTGGSWWTGIGQLGLLAWNSENTLAGSISDGGSFSMELG